MGARSGGGRLGMPAVVRVAVSAAQAASGTALWVGTGGLHTRVWITAS